MISNSPGDVKPVLELVARHAAGICKAPFVDIMLVEGNMLRNHASFGELGRVSFGDAYVIDRSTVMGRSITDKEPVHVEDLRDAGGEFRAGREIALQYGHRTTLGVPLLHEGRALGTLMLIRRTEVRPFEERHIALLKTFAGQAAIAIESVPAGRIASAHRRADRVAGAADRDRRHPPGDRELAGRCPAGREAVAERAARILRCAIRGHHRLLKTASFGAGAL